MEMKKLTQFNKRLPESLITRFETFVVNYKRKLFRTDEEAAALVFEAGLDVVEKEAEKQISQKNAK